DGRAFFDPKSENVIFTRARGKSVFLFSVSVRRPLILKPFSNISNASDWVRSQDRKYQAWIEWTSDFKNSDLKIKTPTGSVTLLSDFKRIKKDPSFVPGSDI